MLGISGVQNPTKSARRSSKMLRHLPDLVNAAFADCLAIKPCVFSPYVFDFNFLAQCIFHKISAAIS
jgi:hypothetical protein